MLARELDDLQRQLWQHSQHQFFALDLPVQASDLLGQRPQEEQQPRLPLRHLAAYGALRPAKGQQVRAQRMVSTQWCWTKQKGVTSSLH